MKSKSKFKTIRPLKQIPEENISFLTTLIKIHSGEINEGIIVLIPHNNESLFIDHFKISNIINKHGPIPLENMIITATEPTSIITGIIDEKSYITLVYEFGDGGLVLSARKFNGHYIVTFFEPSDANYIKSIKKRGKVIFENKNTL